MEGSHSTDFSPDKQAKPPQPIEKTFFGGFLKLRDGTIDMTEYEKMRADPSVAIKAFCLHRTADLKPPYTLREVKGFEEDLGESLGALGTYLTEVSREIVFGYYRHVIALEIPTQERILGTVTKQRGCLMNSEQHPSTLLRITTDGCAFSKALVIKGHFLGAVWALSDDEPELIAADFQSWLYMGMKQVMVAMMHAARVKEAGGQSAYMEQRRKAAAERKASYKTKEKLKGAGDRSLKLKKLLAEVQELQAEIKAAIHQPHPREEFATAHDQVVDAHESA